MPTRKSDEPHAPRVRLTLRQHKLLALIANEPRTPDALRSELYGRTGTRLTVTEARNVLGGVAVLESNALVAKGDDGSYTITTRGRLRLKSA
jgi:hypothetical protein